MNLGPKAPTTEGVPTPPVAPAPGGRDPRPSSRLGELLVRLGLVTPGQVGEAVNLQRTEHHSLVESLVKLGFIDGEAVVLHLQREYRLPRFDLETADPPEEVLRLVPEPLARNHLLIPIQRDGATLTIAVADPTNLAALDQVRFSTGCALRIVLASCRSIQTSIQRLYGEAKLYYSGVLAELDDDNLSVVKREKEVDTRKLLVASEEAPIVKLVSAIMVDAISKRASDIHIEPYEKEVRVRFRIDGVLYDITQPPQRFHGALVSRIKILASLDISERRLPQDGAIRIRLAAGKEVNFRVSVLPTSWGEKVVLRILDKAETPLQMAQLGLRDEVLRSVNWAITRPHGMLLVTGPTGSGKTTTLYAALTELNDSCRNICSAEDPIEISLRGVNQVQVNEGIGLSFATCLRSFLRQDPDVIFVGEIRDFETAEIAVKAALTGHLVLSTLHTNDAPSTPNRLLDMGVEPFLVASSLKMVIAQRLVRLICAACRRPTDSAPLSALIEIGFTTQEAKSLTLYHGVGCDECAGTGYRGRTAIFECMPIDDAMREVILERASTGKVRQAARRRGMATLAEAGLDRVREGVTTIEEVLRVITAD
jgi:type IV pilus assembly protein PilB